MIRTGAALVLFLFTAWASLALWLDSPHPVLLLAGFGFATVAGQLYFKSWRSRLQLQGLLILAILWWWLGIQPSNSRDWQPDVARLPSVTISGDQATFHNVRNFEYRSETDFTPHWEDRTFDLSQIQGADLFLSDWGATGIVHTIVSWDFGAGKHLAISIETRKIVGANYSALRGFFRQYELYYVVADERDVVGVRANVRGEKLHLYRIGMPPEIVRSILLSYIESINRLNQTPEWYNALDANCTTSIRLHAKSAGVAKSLNWRLFANKHLDELLYLRGSLNTSLPLDELRARSDVTEAAKSAGTDPNFSEIIREKLPARPS